mmetsp:Transcript_4868/g.17649  ORF Transcript_4868/g.17649 Transcript_4868/m.17649 type:complete len:508 (-) Transcript_4868:1092-2615(-)
MAMSSSSELGRFQVLVCDGLEDHDDLQQPLELLMANKCVRYTPASLRSVFQFLGCRPRHAHKVRMWLRLPMVRLRPATVSVHSGRTSPLAQACNGLFAVWEARVRSTGQVQEGPDGQADAYSLTLSRKEFEEYATRELASFGYAKDTQLEEFRLACSVWEKRRSVTILLCGTSGCGKSTLASLLGSRLGITTVLSTDTLRHMMRSFVDTETNPLLWASTYSAGQHLDNSFQSDHARTLHGYKAQSEMVVDWMDSVISACERRKESLIVEGVHLNIRFVMRLYEKHPTMLPFLIYIENEAKHKERFAVRAKYMTLDAKGNKYVQNLRNIRLIQDYLCRRADKHKIPKVNNTNVDRSVAAIHNTVFSCLVRMSRGESVTNEEGNQATMVYEEFQRHTTDSLWSSKGVLHAINLKRFKMYEGHQSDTPSTSTTSVAGGDYDDEGSLFSRHVDDVVSSEDEAEDKAAGYWDLDEDGGNEDQAGGPHHSLYATGDEVGSVVESDEDAHDFEV